MTFKLIFALFLLSNAHSEYQPDKIVELAVFVDQYLYHYWMSTLNSPSSIQHFIRSYFDVLLQSLNLIYAHPSLEEVPIGFHLAHSEIFWRGDPGNIQKNRDTASNYLEAFCDFANKENWSGTRWDHALLLTGVDLKFPNGTNYAVAGISWDNSMCNKTYSCSVVEGKTFRSIITAAHEIAHSLGIEHDGLKHNYKCPRSGFIMANAGGDSGKIAWSPCSKHNLKAFLVAASSVLNNQAACLNNKPLGRRQRGFRHNAIKRKMQKLPGKRFTLEEQCKLGGGNHWAPSRDVEHIKVCYYGDCIFTRSEESSLWPSKFDYSFRSAIFYYPPNNHYQTSKYFT